MKKIYLALVLALSLLSVNTFSQGLTGTKTINPIGSGVNNFISLKQAIDTLNFYGVGANGVTFNVASGITETAPVGGYSITATGVLGNPIIFQKDGSGANPIFESYIGGTATNASASSDGILKLVGSDYVTIDGLDFRENAANTSNPSTMEFGIALFKQSVTNGAQYNTIKNCNITLNRINNASGSGPMFNGSIGILIINSIPTATTTALTPTAVSGSNSFNKIYSNKVENTNLGIALNGFSTSSTFTFCDFGNDIGGSSVNTGNTILNFGGGGITNASSGIQVQNNYDFNVSFNTINSNNGNGVSHGNAALRGIFCNASATSASGVVSNNKVTVKSIGTTTTVYGIDVQAGSTAASNTININNNIVENCSYLTATSGTFYGISAATSAANVLITNNKIRNFEYSALTLTGTGSMFGIVSTGASPNLSISLNSISNLNSYGTTNGTIFGIQTTSAAIQSVTSDTIYNLSISGTGTAGTIYGISTATGTIVVNNNIIHHLLNNKTTGTSPIYGVYNLSSPTNENYNNNTIYNLTHAGPGIVRGIYTFTTTGTRTVSGNIIYTLSTGNSTVEGINQQSSTPSVFRNKIYDLTANGASGIAYGINITSGNTNINIYNNFISDLKAPITSLSSDAVRGITITSISATTDINVYHNTIYLNASSTGANFSSSAIFHTTSTTATVARLNLRNNILINKCIPSGTGITSAYRRSSTTLTNFNSASNKNIFYAGIPSANNLIFYDGTNSDQTIAGYKTRVAPRETYSHTEDVTFTNAALNDLHITAGTISVAESAGDLISTILTDFDGQVRPGPVGSTFGGASVPDIGADEYDGVPQSPFGDIIAPSFSIDSIRPSLNTCLSNPHTFYVKIIDASAIDTAIILWNLGNLGAQTPINFVNISGNRYSASIPSFLDSTISYSFRIVDGSINKNVTTVAGSNYRDRTYTVQALADNLIVNAGTNITLRATSPVIAQLGTATTAHTTSSNAGAAYPTYFGNGRQQYLILASELIGLGFQAGQLKSLGFNVVTPGTGTGATLNGYTIKIGTTTVNSMSTGIQTIIPTTVFGPLNYTPLAGINTHVFTTPFNWDGTSNIIVDVCFSNQITGTTTTQNIVRTSATSFVSTAYYQADGTGGAAACTNTSTTNASVRPNMYWEGAKPPVSATWSASANAGLNSTSGLTVTASPTIPGTYSYNVSASNGTCLATSSISINVLSPLPPVADFSASSVTATVGATISTITFADATTNIPSTWKWTITPSTYTFVNNTTATSKNPQVQFSSVGNYTVKLVATNVSGADSITKSNFIIVTTSYCTTSLHTTASVCIDTVSYGNILNTSGGTCTLPSYTLQTATTSVMKLAPTPIFVKTSASAIVSVWIDYNQNGLFESSEWTQLYTTGTSGTKTIVVPSSAKTGNTTMRVRSRSSATANGAGDACTSFTSGETEDYPITIIPTVGDFYAPDFANTSSINPAGGACTSVAHTVSIGITDTTGVNPDSVSVRYTINGVAQTPIAMIGVANVYSATIPATTSTGAVSYSFRAVDTSPQKNVGTKFGGTYTDAQFNVKATTSSDSITLGSTVQLGISNPIANVGAGTTSNSTSSNAGAAYPTFYGNGRQQYLIRASELTAIGVTAGLFNSLAFDVSTVGTGAGATLNGYTIKLGSTTNSTLATNFATSTFTTVFSATSYTPVVGPNVHTFSTPYFWDGSSNILVDICFSNGITGTSSTQNTNKTHTTTFASSVFYQADGTGGAGACTTTTVSSSVSVRPNMVFTKSPSTATYVWSVGAGGNLLATSIINPTATPSLPGTYYFKVTANNGTCTISDSVRVKVIVATKPTPNFSANTTLGFTNTTIQFNDLSANLPSNWTWSFSPNTVTYVNSTTKNSKNPSVQYTAPGFYTVKLVSTNGAGSDSITKTNYIQVLTAPCTTSLHSSSSSCISSVSFNTISITGSTCALPSYSLQTATTTLLKAVTYPLTITTSAAGIASVWIDINRNGIFEASEWTQLYTNASSGTVNITLPISAQTGATLMRIRSRATGSPNGSGDACTAFGSGETKDFIIMVTNPVGDYYAPTISNISFAPAAACIAVSHNISATVFDTTGIDTVQLDYTLNGVAQPRILMTTVSGNIYTASIPAAGAASVSYRIYAKDNSAQRNSTFSAYSSYRDEQLKASMTLGADKQIAVGGNAQLSVMFPKKVGTGSAVYSLSNASNIFDRFYGGRKTQYLYLASELQALGLTAGPISSISFFANTPQVTATAFNDFAIEMKLTTASVLTGGTLDVGTNVYGPSSLTPTIASGKITFPFTNTFAWDGTSNILVSVCWSNTDLGNTATSTNQSVFLEYSVTPANSVVYRRVDNTTSAIICAYTTGGTNTANRANAEFGVSNGSYTYSWTQSTNGGLSSTTISDPIATPTAGVGTYQYVVNVNDGTCIAKDTINVDVVAAPLVNLGPDGTICGNTPRILDAGNPGSNYVWTYNGTALGTGQTMIADIPGTYKVVVTNVTGFSSVDSIVLTAAPALTLNVPNQNLCAGGNITVNPGSFTGYLWSTGATTPTIQISQLGTYSVTVTNATGCTTTDTFQVVQGSNPIVNLGSNQSICKSNPIVLNAGNTGSTYLWSTGATSQSITVSNAGTYFVKVTSPSGCFARDTIVITNLVAPIVDLGINKQECAGIPIVLDAGNAGSTYLWNTGATTKSITVTSAGSFIVKVTNASGCSTNDTITITRFAPVVVSLGADKNICTSDTITLDAGNTGSTYLWTTGATTKTIRVSLAGTYGVTVTNNLGCVGTDEIIVTNKATPNSNFTFNRTAGLSVQFNVTQTPGCTYSWNFGDPTSNGNTSALVNPIHEFTSKSSFIVTLTVNNISTGCVSIKTENIGSIWSGVNSAPKNAFNFEVYPNPITNKSVVKYNVLNETSDVSLEVYNILGKKVYSYIANEKQLIGKHEIEIGNLTELEEKSMLFIHLVIDGKVVTQKVLLSNLK